LVSLLKNDCIKGRGFRGNHGFPLIKLIKRKRIKISVLYNSNGIRNERGNTCQKNSKKTKNYKTRKS
jgi:hypothetical protein